MCLPGFPLLFACFVVSLLAFPVVLYISSSLLVSYE